MTWDEFREWASSRAGMHAVNGDLAVRLAYLALGLCGELTMMALVLGVMAAPISPKSGRKVPGVSGTRTTTPPASSMFGT